jgi:hypothetical protein
LWAVNLDSQDAPITVPVRADGSFVFSIDLALGQELRLQARRGYLRSAPRDFVLATEKTLVERSPPVCWTLPLELDFGAVRAGTSASRSVAVNAACLPPFEVSAAFLRRASTAFRLDSSGLPRALTRGEAFELPVGFAPPSTQDFEEIAFVEITAPGRERLAVTLLGRGVQ